MEEAGVLYQKTQRVAQMGIALRKVGGRNVSTSYPQVRQLRQDLHGPCRNTQLPARLAVVHQLFQQEGKHIALPSNGECFLSDCKGLPAVRVVERLGPQVKTLPTLPLEDLESANTASVDEDRPASFRAGGLSKQLQREPTWPFCRVRVTALSSEMAASSNSRASK